jgi:hypothetical protein
LGDKIKEDEAGGACGMYGGEEKYACRVVVEGNRLLGRPRNRWSILNK